MTDARCIGRHTHDPDRPRRALDRMLLCAGCYARLQQTLAEMPAVTNELTRSLVPRKGAGGPKVSGTPETALPFDEDAGRILRIITHQIGSWVLLLTEEYVPKRLEVAAGGYPVQPGQTPQMIAVSRPLAIPQPPTIAALTGFLLLHLDWTCAQPWADEFAGQLADLRSEARTVLRAAPRRKVDLGPCGNPNAIDVSTRALVPCPGVIRATVSRTDDLLPSVVTCTECGTDHPADTWHALGRRLSGTDDRWLTAAQASELLRVPIGTVWRWAAEHQWRRRDQRPRRYHADDVQRTYDQHRREGAA